MSAQGFADHFSARAASYAVYRPNYPPEFVAWLAGLAPARELAWDAGTGNGQAATLLAEHFAAVEATDPSDAQLSLAKTHSRVRYRLAREGESGLAAGSVDLVTVAQALHWFDLSRFYPEAERVLKPRGVIAVWCYSLARMDAAVTKIFRRWHDERVQRHWPPERRHTDSGYRELSFPFEEMAAPSWTMTAYLTRAQFLGYVSTWSSVAAAQRTEGLDLVAELAAAFAPVWRADDERQLRIEWPLGLRIGRRAS